jgi:glycosyltransferase involved in cell wall biosynthesis
LQPVAVIPNGVDVPARSGDAAGPQQPHGDGRRTLLYLGRIHPKKGLDMALPAWRAVQDAHPRWNFRIIGRGDATYVASLRALANELGAERVSFEDAAYGDAKRDAMRAADVFILPTRNENFGMVVAEALAEATPVLTTTGAPWEGLVANGCGWWSEIGVEPIADALRQAFATPTDGLRGMGRRGAEWMIRDFSWEAIGTNTADFYHWLRHGGQAPRFVHLTDNPQR